MMVLLTKLVNKDVNYYRKRIILDAWLGSEGCSADLCITVLKIQIKICKDERQVKMESF